MHNAHAIVSAATAGNIEASFVGLHPQLPASFTANGEIEVTLPAEGKALLKVKSVSGDIFTDFDVVVQKQ